MSEYLDKSEAVGEGYLQDWYISSVSEDDEPVWTEAHIEELANDFIVIPKDTPAADVTPVVHGHWTLERDPDDGNKPVCYHCSVCDSDGCHTSIRIAYKYCPNCGAKMDGRGKK